jgi:quercetin dioxygenase-like cupin family protein
MLSSFHKIIQSLPQADVPIKGATVYLSQGADHQVAFMEFTEDVDVPEHTHADQWETVIAGRVDLTINGVKNTFNKGENFYIPEGVKHSARIYAGFASIAFFNQKDRYKLKFQDYLKTYFNPLKSE